MCILFLGSYFRMRAFVAWGMRMRSTIFTMRRTAITVLFTGAVASCGTSFSAGSSLCVVRAVLLGSCPNWRSRRSVHSVSLPSRFSGILCLAFFVRHPGSSALVTV